MCASVCLRERKRERKSRDKCQYLERKSVFPMDGGVSVQLMSLKLIAGTRCDEWL